MSGNMKYTTVVGLEVHVQLLTRTKLFCGCLNRFNPTQPNVQTCPVCLGLPGSLPVMNRYAFELALKTGMALNCTIPPLTKWDRKQYYYPDLPKGYQISQYDLPFSSKGWLELVTDALPSETKRIGIIRAHLEEDAGKNIHDESGGGGDSLIDLNRAGTPLLEIVSEPDLRSGAEAHAYLDELKLLLTYLEVSDCNMQEGSLRCDANVNLHVHGDDGQTIATPIVEIKNLNSFRGVEAAIEYEAKRQFDEWQRTGHKLGDVPKETRGWDAARGVTFAQRGKEEAADYRYFPDPDLVPVTVSEEKKRQIRDHFCEFPAAKRSRFERQHQLSRYDASVIVAQGKSFADYFERVAAACGDAKQAANWVTQDVLREMKERKTSIEEFPISSDVLAAILSKIGQRKITTNSGRTIFAEILARGEAVAGAVLVEEIIAEKSLAITADIGELAPVIDAVLAKNAKIVADVQGGKQQAIGALIGQVIRQAKGADPQVVREMLVAKIAALP
jgi:aspartyl-tRNA(Asn)/glutamyl-tRNA(Gln) amidotransferase subunit B